MKCYFVHTYVTIKLEFFTSKKHCSLLTFMILRLFILCFIILNSYESKGYNFRYQEFQCQFGDFIYTIMKIKV